MSRRTWLAGTPFNTENPASPVSKGKRGMRQQVPHRTQGRETLTSASVSECLAPGEQQFGSMENSGRRQRSSNIDPVREGLTRTSGANLTLGGCRRSGLKALSFTAGEGGPSPRAGWVRVYDGNLPFDFDH